MQATSTSSIKGRWISSWGMRARTKTRQSRREIWERIMAAGEEQGNYMGDMQSAGRRMKQRYKKEERVVVEMLLLLLLLLS